jgi:hypothetical protein
VGTEFNWFSGIADIAIACPAELTESGGGLRPFFEAPNAPQWGLLLPRWLYHECLHFWQLASSRYLQLIVVAEWERVAAFERDGTVPPSVSYPYGQAASGEPFSVRDLVECLARFWDVHTRGATRILREEENDLDGRLAAIDAIRFQGAYSGEEFDGVMVSGRDREIYARPYHWMRERAAAAPAVRELPGSIDSAAGWAVNLLLPIAGFVALNTEAPVAAFVATFDRGLQADCIAVAAGQRDRRHSINLDWLDFWAVLAPGMARALRRVGLSTWLGAPGFGVLENPAFRDHPVYRHLPARLEALSDVLRNLRLSRVFNPPRDDSEDIGEAFLLRELAVTAQDYWPVFSLPGQPNFRLLLGSVFAPLLVRFIDREIPATASAWPDWPWPVDGPTLAAAAHQAETRLHRLHGAEAAARLGLPLDAFTRA